MCSRADTDPRQLYADIIIDISHEALDKVFQYRVPFSMREKIRPGSRVRVPFGRGNKSREGYVIHICDKADYDPEKIKEILELVPDRQNVTSDLIEVAAFLKDHYGGSMNQALKTVMPVKRKMKTPRETKISLRLSREEAGQILKLWEKKHYSARVRLLSALLEEGSLSRQEAVKISGLSSKALADLAEKKIISIRSRIRYRNPFEKLEMSSERPVLTDEQEAILREYDKDIREGRAATYLLYGVTGSGKTEVYLSLIERVLAEGRQAIVLIPEISLTYQTVSRFYRRFGDRIAVINSRLSQGEKSDQITRITEGEADVVIGPRSALFAPLDRLGIIIVDEEHDNAYKSEQTPKYHAIEVARFRAGLSGASVVLGSATPLVESYEKARRGEYKLWKMTKRPGAARLATTMIVDMRKEFRGGNRSMFSGLLHDEIRGCLQRKEQVVLFLNRRGFAGFVSCRSCGEVKKCPHCDVSLTYHRDGKLRCHYCGYEEIYTKLCPVCRMPHMAAFGLGTEKVESALAAEFPEAKVLRMDLDTTRKKNAHEKILKSFEAGEADILLGTQMIVKGHDYPNVTLVGILAADQSLHSQDFRSAERTFALLTQAAGRAGRGDKPGKVIIQTYSPDHYAIKSAADQSYQDFFINENSYRSLMHYPPHAHMLAILVQAGSLESVELAAGRIAKMIEKSQEKEKHPVQILGPGKARLSKLKDVHRQIIYIKHEDAGVIFDLERRLTPVLQSHPYFQEIFVQFDYDPVTFY